MFESCKLAKLSIFNDVFLVCLTPQEFRSVAVPSWHRLRGPAVLFYPGSEFPQLPKFFHEVSLTRGVKQSHIPYTLKYLTGRVYNVAKEHGKYFVTKYKEQFSLSEGYCRGEG
jgi:hypothetical protein